MDEVVVIGDGGHAGVVVDIIENAREYRIAAIVGRMADSGDKRFGYPLLAEGEESDRCLEQHRRCVVALGDNFRRLQLFDRLERSHPSIEFVSCVHPGAWVGSEVTIGPGTVVMAGVIINRGARTGRGCILNTNSSLDHDASMGDFASLAPNAAVGGEVRIGAGSTIAMGACVAHRVEIGAHTVIGAGAAVLEDIAARSLAVGVPARVVRDLEIGETCL